MESFSGSLKKNIMMIKQGKQRAVLFADVSGSSALYKTKGNSEAKAIISHLLNLVQKITVEHKGRVVKTIGDEVMVCFSSGQDSIETAIAIQQNFSSSYTQHHLTGNKTLPACRQLSSQYYFLH